MGEEKLAKAENKIAQLRNEIKRLKKQLNRCQDKVDRLIEEAEGSPRLRLYDVRQHKVVEKVFSKNRWHVILDSPFKGEKRMPLANYNWLMSNPGFECVPKGYVIHHLDHNEQNDDPTNLALMTKNLHSAYHWKYKTDDTPIRFEDSHKFTTPDTISKVKIYHKKPDRFYISWYQDGERNRLFSYKGRVFKTREDAKWAIKEIQREYRIPD